MRVIAEVWRMPEEKERERERDRGQIDREEAWPVPECHLLRRSPDKQIYVSSFQKVNCAQIHK